MTYQDLLDELRYESAKLLLNKTTDERIVQLFNELICLEIYFDEFLGVIDRSYYRPDFLKSVALSLARLEIASPENTEEAIWVVLKHHIPRMTSIDNDPLDILDKLIADVYWDDESRYYAGVPHGTEHLVSLYWEYDDLCMRYYPDLPTDAEIDGLKKHARIYARDWLDKYAT